MKAPEEREPEEALEQARMDDSKTEETLQREEKAAQKKDSDRDKSAVKPEYQKYLDELKEYKEKYIRLLAEFDNVKKRTEREKLEFIKYANEELLGHFLGILDDLERSVEAAKTKHEDYNAFLKGIELVMARVYELLRKNKVQPIEALGKKFDPHLHEALMQEETDKFKEGTVVEEFQKGYILDGRVIRTAKVKVATAKPRNAQNEIKQ